MGIWAAKSAILLAAQFGLGNSATRLLVHMALECWDEARPEQEPRRYFAGRESSAVALGYIAPSNASDAAHSAVKRAVSQLVQAGAIQRLRAGGYGARSEYELLLDSHSPSAARGVIPFPKRAGQGTSGSYPQGVEF